MEGEGWLSLKQQDFLKKFPNSITPATFDTNKLRELMIDRDGLNELIYEKDIYKKYLNGCGEHNSDRFPLYSVIITNYKKREKPIENSEDEFYKNYTLDHQESFEFLRTENGYKLLSVPVNKRN